MVSAPLRALVRSYIGGGWGKDSFEPKYEEPAWVIRGTDFADASVGIVDSIPYRFHGTSNLKSRRLQAFDVLIEVSGGSADQPVGRVMLVDEHVLGSLDGPVVCASFCKRVAPDPEKVAPEYLYWFLEATYVSGLIERYQVQSTGIRNLQFEYMLDDLQVPLPPRETQERVAAALGSIHELVRGTRRRMDLLREAAHLLYDEWVIHRRYPGRDDVQTIDSGLGPIPRGWAVAPFAHLADFINGFAFRPGDHWTEDGLPIVKIKELKNGVVSETPRYHGRDIPKKYFIDDGDLLFSWSADLDAYIWDGGPALLNQHLFVVRPHELSVLFLYHSLSSQMEQFRARSQGTTMKHIKRSVLSEVHTIIPDERTRARFEEQVGPLLDLRLTLARQLRALSAIRDLLLPRLVSGVVDVSSLELALEPVG